MFDLHGNERLTEWKKFRDSLETSETPYRDLARFWSRAPFVSSYLNPFEPNSWPDPWHLVLDDRLDDLAIALGMLYTLKLTQRFMDTKCEIHMSMPLGDKDHSYLVVIDNKHVLNYEYGEVVDVEKISGVNTNMIWSKSKV